MSTRDFATQFPACELFDSGTQVSEKMLVTNAACFSSEKVREEQENFSNLNTVQLKYIKTQLPRLNKATQTQKRIRSIGTNTIKKIVKPIEKPKPKITSTITIPSFMDLTKKGASKYINLPNGMQIKKRRTTSTEEYEPKFIPGDPINNVTYIPTPIDHVEDLDLVFTDLEGAYLQTNRDDIFETKSGDFSLWIKTVRES